MNPNVIPESLSKQVNDALDNPDIDRVRVDKDKNLIYVVPKNKDQHIVALWICIANLQEQINLLKGDTE